MLLLARNETKNFQAASNFHASKNPEFSFSRPPPPLILFFGLNVPKRENVKQKLIDEKAMEVNGF